MNTRHRRDDEGSFEGLVSFDSVPPKGSGPDDVHSASTAVAEIPDAFIEALKSGVKADVSRLAKRSHAAAPPIPRVIPEEPEEIEAIDDDTHVFEVSEPPTSPYGPKILGPAPAPPAKSPEPYAPSPSYAPSRAPDRISFVAPSPVVIAARTRVDPRPPRSVAVTLAVVVACAVSLALWMWMLRHLV